MRPLHRWLILFFVFAGLAQARPWWKQLNATGDEFPARYGYDVSRREEGGISYFTILIDTAAAKLLESVQLIGGKEWSRTIAPSDADPQGWKRIEFSVATAELPIHHLRLNSGPVPFGNEAQLDNFHGYSIALSSIPIQEVVPQGIFNITARRNGSTIDYTVTIPEQPRLLTQETPSRWDVAACTLTGTIAGERIVIPVEIKFSTTPDREACFSLPASQVSGLILRMDLSNWNPRKMETQIVRVSLARIAVQAK